MRADEHEGVLNDTEVKRQADQRNAEASKILFDDILSLTANEQFIRWFSKFAFALLAQDVREHGADLERFMGRRSLALLMVADMDVGSPGFLNRMFEVRANYERRLDAATKEK